MGVDRLPSSAGGEKRPSSAARRGRTSRGGAASVVALQQLAGNRATAGLLSRQTGPTYGNLPRDLPKEMTSGAVVQLRNVNGTWREIGPRYSRTARGGYDFVVREGQIWAVKTKNTMGALGHTEAARGQRVQWAGQVEFEAGKVKAWNDGSGHYRPLSSMREPAVRAGLPDDKFARHPETLQRPRTGPGPQLPVEQPATRPPTPGEPPNVGPGPPRMEEFEQRFGKKPPAAPTEVPSAAPGATTATTATATSTAALADEAATVLKSQGRMASAISKIGSAAGWVADFLMPGPQDALMLMVQFAMTYAEAQEAARAEGLRSGFRQGLTAGLLRLSRRWVRDNLAPKVVSRTVASEVAATTGYREKGFVQGLAAGIGFAERLSAEQRKALLNEAVRLMRQKGDDVRLRDWWERGYTAFNIIDLSVALAPRVDEILEEARRNEELRAQAAMLERYRKYGPLAPVAHIFE